MSLRCAILAGCILLFVVAASQTLAQQNRSDSPIKVQTTLVNVPVIVSDRSGRYMSGLKLEDFKLYEDRIQQPIAIFDSTEEPINVALLLDTSLSTRPVIDDIKREAGNFLKELRTQDRALIISFDCDVHDLSDLTSDKRALDQAVRSARTGDRVGTALRDAVATVIERRFKHIEGRKAIILLTDGKDVGSEIPEPQLIDEATESGSMIYSVFFETGNLRRGWIDPLVFPRRRVWLGGPGRTPSRPNEQRQRRIEMRNERAVSFLEELSEVSAGRYYNSEVSDLKKTFRLVAEELRHQYRLGFYPDSAKADGQRHSLKVEVSIPDAVVRARRSYQATSFVGGS